MKIKNSLLILAFSISSTCFCQNIFNQGYYITNSGEEIKCLLKNIDSQDTPNEIAYKLSANSETKIIRINAIKEFGIPNKTKFIKKNILIDKSSDNINQLSKEKNPIFKEEQLFLKVLVEGESTLYYYRQGNLIRFFYNIKDEDVHQLIYKRFEISENQIDENNEFRQQLWNDLNCSSNTITKLKQLSYTKNELQHFFMDYNNCINSNYLLYKEEEKNIVLHISLRPHLNNSSLSIQNSLNSYPKIEYDNTYGIGFGVEFEMLLPFNKNKWSFSLEPTYQSFKTTKVSTADNVYGGQLKTEVNYNSIEIPLTIRHYFNLNTNSKLYINAALILDFNSKSKLTFKRADDSEILNLNLNSSGNFGFGFGYKYNNTISMEMRIHTPRNILSNYESWRSDYNNIALILGYTIL